MVSGVGAGLQFLNFAAVGHYTETPVAFGRLQSSLRSTHPTLEGSFANPLLRLVG